ncbi:hypothetical protein [Klebsiella pneumoniae]|uniref:hypothetical protein n=1 Tax=Klebsiella pneumoniae TaxID=573 RepID=UPI0025A00CEE|nr:hypothetical protein [Klebsiella pneumoniae]
MHILNQFDKLMAHLNGEENGMAAEFREALESVSDSAEFLECLEAAGVDNWVGYEYAQEDYQENLRE